MKTIIRLLMAITMIANAKALNLDYTVFNEGIDAGDHGGTSGVDDDKVTLRFYVPNGSADGTYMMKTTQYGNVFGVVVTAGVSNYPDSAHARTFVFNASDLLLYYTGHAVALYVLKPDGTNGPTFNVSATDNGTLYSHSIASEAAKPGGRFRQTEKGPMDITATAPPTMGTVEIQIHGVWHGPGVAHVNTTIWQVQPLAEYSNNYNVADPGITFPVTAGASMNTTLTTPGRDIAGSTKWEGDSMEVEVTSGGVSLGVAAIAHIGAPDATTHKSVVVIELGELGDRTPEPVMPSDPPTADPTNQGSVTVPGVTTPATTGTTTTDPTTGVITTTAGTPEVTTPDKTIVNNSNTTLSGTATGATNQDIYEDVYKAMTDALKASGLGQGGSGDGGGGGGTVSGTLNTGDQPEGVGGSQGDDLKGKVIDALGVQSDIQTGLQTKFNSIAPGGAKALALPTSLGSKFTWSPSLPILGEVHVDITSYASTIALFRLACLMVLAIGAFFASIKIIRQGVA